MKTLHTKDDIPSKELIKGTVAFLSMLAKSPKTVIGMTRALVSTCYKSVPHDTLNNDQRILLTPHRPPKYIAILVPGFQLDGKSLSEIKKALNERGIPALFPMGLPHGNKAIFFHDHPQILVDEIVEYTKKVQAKFPEAHILMIGHSFGGTQALHAVDQLEKERTFSTSNPKIIPITIAGVLDTFGSAAKALHALYWDAHSGVFSGENDNFIPQARVIQIAQKQGITLVDSEDGYLPEHIQAGARHKEAANPKIIYSTDKGPSKGKSPGHYLHGKNPGFARQAINKVLDEVMRTPETTPQ